MELRERKIINNGAAAEKLPEYAEGKWLHGASLQSMDSMIPGSINLLGSAVNSFGGVKSSSNILAESGTSIGQGSGFTYLKLNQVDAGALMSELSQLNTANTLLTAAAGASMGAAFGPIGAGIGGVVGGAAGFIGGLFRKSKMADRIKKALILAINNNNYALASALSDYLTNDYNAKHDNTQDDLLYSAKDGHKPVYSASGYADGKPNAMGSHHEWVIDTFDGEEIQLPGKPDKKDTVELKLKHPEATAIVSNNRYLDGIRNSDYYTLTKDLDGALARDQWYRNMKDYRTVLLLHNDVFDKLNNGYKCGKRPKYAGGKGAIEIAPPPVLTTEQMDAIKVPERQANLTESTKNTLGVSPKDLEANNYMTDAYRNKIGGDPIYRNEFERTFEQNPKMKNTSTWSNPNDWIMRNGNLVTRLQAALDDANKNIYNSNLVNAIANGLSMFGGLALIIKSHEPAAELKSVYYNPYERQATDLALNRRSNLNLLFSDSARAEAMNRYNILNRLGGLSGALKMLMMQNSGIANQYTNAKLRAADNEYKNNRDFQNAQFIAGLGDTKGKYGWLSSETFYDRLNKAMGMKWANWQEGMYNMINPFLTFAKGYNNNTRFKAILPFYTTDYKAFG